MSAIAQLPYSFPVLTLGAPAEGQQDLYRALNQYANDVTRSLQAIASTCNMNFTALTRLGAALFVQASTPPSMSLQVAAGHILSETTLTEIAAQATSAFTAPITHPRIDRLVLNSGMLAVRAGTEAASPTPPSFSSGDTPLAQVALFPGMAAIAANGLTDERALGLLDN